MLPNFLYKWNLILNYAFPPNLRLSLFFYEGTLILKMGKLPISYASQYFLSKLEEHLAIWPYY